MSIKNESYYKPDEALQELAIQKTIINLAVDIQALLRILVDKEIITREEMNTYREEVRSSPKYKNTIDEIERMKNGFNYYKDNPTEHLKAVFKAKMNGDIK